MGFRAAVLRRSDPSCDFDLTQLSLSGVCVGQAAVVVLAVLAVTAEYETGMIRTTLAACPRRLAFLAAKAVVVVSVVLLVSVVSVSRRCCSPGGSSRATDSRAAGFRPLSLADEPTLRASAAPCCTLAWSR